MTADKEVTIEIKGVHMREGDDVVTATVMVQRSAAVPALPTARILATGPVEER